MLNTIFLKAKRDKPTLCEHELRLLVDKYLDGGTTNDEEEQLRQHFTDDNAIIPSDLNYMKSLFAYEITHQGFHHNSVSKSMYARKMRIFACAIAAASVTLLAAIIWPIKHGDCNYLLVDGQRYASNSMVMREAEAMLDMVSYKEDCFNALEMMRPCTETSD